MRSLKLTNVRTLGTVIVVATLVMAVASVGNTAVLEELPGKSLDEFSCGQIYGGTEICMIGDEPCTFSTYKGCDKIKVTYGEICADEGAACGEGACSGPNHEECVGSGGGCVEECGFCCTVTFNSCATHGSGTAEDPYVCRCDGPKTDVAAMTRVICHVYE